MNAKDHEIARDMERLREELNKTSSALEAEKAKSSEASSSFEQRARDLEKEIGGLKEQLAALRKELDDGRKEIQRLSDLKAGLEQANIKIKAESSAELESLRKKNDALAAEKSGLAEQVKSLEAKLAEKPATPAPAQ
jgi:predicted  nucleic acid-binding Zn-ribbon protein